jgi:hypothetical protein
MRQTDVKRHDRALQHGANSLAGCPDARNNRSMVSNEYICRLRLIEARILRKSDQRHSAPPSRVA